MTLLKHIIVRKINVFTLNGKLEEVVELMLERNIDIMGICETRLNGEGMKKIHDDFQLIFFEPHHFFRLNK